MSASYIPSKTKIKVVYHTVTSGEESAKSLTLPGYPKSLQLDVVDGGGAQVPGRDFTYSGTTLSWDGLALDGVIAEGDILRITYSQ